jgi:hypothetical protein
MIHGGSFTFSPTLRMGVCTLEDLYVIGGMLWFSRDQVS